MLWKFKNHSMKSLLSFRFYWTLVSYVPNFLDYRPGDFLLHLAWHQHWFTLIIQYIHYIFHHNFWKTFSCDVKAKFSVFQLLWEFDSEGKQESQEKPLKKINTRCGNTNKLRKKSVIFAKDFAETEVQRKTFPVSVISLRLRIKAYSALETVFSNFIQI